MVGGLATFHAFLEALSDEGTGLSPDLVRNVDWCAIAECAEALYLQFHTTTVYSRLSAAIGNAEAKRRTPYAPSAHQESV
jgi:hypothetical protein